jgi:phosphoribosylaminoimidazole carboxylase PurE protein
LAREQTGCCKGFEIIRAFIALAGLLLASTSVLAQPAVPNAAPAPLASSSVAGTGAPVAVSVLSAEDVALYKDIMGAERKGDAARAKRLSAKLSDPSLLGYAEAVRFMSAAPKRVTVKPLVTWLEQNRELAVADRIYRLAVARSTKKVRRHRKTITVAVVTNIPAPVGVGKRTGGYEDLELPEPWPAEAPARGVKVFIVGAGAAAHLAGVVASLTTKPVIGVPIDSSALKGMDALLSTVQMPPGVPVATVAIGKPGATNAGVLAAQMIALGDPAMGKRLEEYKRTLEAKVEAAAKKLETS